MVCGTDVLPGLPSVKDGTGGSTNGCMGCAPTTGDASDSGPSAAGMSAPAGGAHIGLRFHVLKYAA